MADAEKGIKNRNRLPLGVFFVLHVATFWYLATDAAPDIGTLRGLLDEALSGKGSVVAIAALAVVILDGLVPTGVKTALVFWQWRCPLPGCRAFSEIARQRPMLIDLGKLEQHFGPLPTVPEEQNRLWYRIYTQHQDKPAVVQAHRDYLLAREAASISAVFLTLLPTSLYLAGAGYWLLTVYTAVLAVLYVTIALAGRNFGINFVAVVLARAV